MKKTLTLLIALFATATLLTACADKTDNTPTTVVTTTAVQKTEAATKAEVMTTNTTAYVTENATPTDPFYTAPDTTATTAKLETAPTTVPATTAAVNTITKEEAKAAVLKHAGLAETDVKRFEIELDRERNGLFYEVDFDAGKYEYEYEVDAVTGKVLKSHKEYRD